MGRPRFSDDFKRDAVHQVVDRGYPVAEVSQRLGGLDSVGHTVPCLHTTSVMRPSFDFRANSSGNFGPSSRHSCEMGRLPGSQINDPQPRQAKGAKFSLLFIFEPFADGSGQV